MSGKFFNSEMTNRDRALRALRAMKEWAGFDYSRPLLSEEGLEDLGDAGQEVLQDLLTDLRHVAQIAELDIDLAFANSESHFIDEMREEE